MMPLKWQDYLITMQNQQLYNEGRVYGNGMNATGASAILGALSNPLHGSNSSKV